MNSRLYALRTTGQLTMPFDIIWLSAFSNVFAPSWKMIGEKIQSNNYSNMHSIGGSAANEGLRI